MGGDTGGILILFRQRNCHFNPCADSFGAFNPQSIFIAVNQLDPEVNIENADPSSRFDLGNPMAGDVIYLTRSPSFCVF
jgi:hypothetical protein